MCRTRTSAFQLVGRRSQPADTSIDKRSPKLRHLAFCKQGELHLLSAVVAREEDAVSDKEVREALATRLHINVSRLEVVTKAASQWRRRADFEAVSLDENLDTERPAL